MASPTLLCSVVSRFTLNWPVQSGRAGPASPVTNSDLGWLGLLLSFSRREGEIEGLPVLLAIKTKNVRGRQRGYYSSCEFLENSDGQI